jgi:predicted dehydrogenase
MSDLKLMVVGVGALGQHHARIVSNMNGVELVAVAEPREEIGREVADRLGTKWIADYREVIEEIDAASIVVPTSLHHTIASDFLCRGISVLVEKPLTANPAEAESLVELADANAAVLQVGHVERFNPAMKAAKNICGPPKYIRAERTSLFPFRSMDIGVVHDLLIHDIDLTLDLVRSQVVDVDAFGISLMSEHEDIVNARLKFANGCVADLLASRMNPEAKRNMQVWSAIGCVTIDFQNREVKSFSPSERLLFGKSPVELAKQPGADIQQLRDDIFGKYIKIEEPDIIAGDALTDELIEFAACVRGEQKPSCDGHAALAAVRIADQVLASVADHSWGNPYQMRDVA